MTKSDTRRAAIIEAIADHVLANGLAAASLRPLARSAGLSDRMLLYYFKDKAEILAAALETLSARLTLILDAAISPQPMPVDTLRRHLAGRLFTPEIWPYLCLCLEMAALSARGDIAMRDAGEAIGRGFLAWGSAQLDSPTPQARAVDAARLLLSIEGMVMLKSLGLDDIVETTI